MTGRGTTRRESPSPAAQRTRAPLARTLLLIAATVLAGACGGSGDRASASEYSAEAGSFDLAAGSPQRFLLGLIGPQQESVAYGSITIDFVFDGPRGRPRRTPRRGPTVKARFASVPGQRADPGAPGPRRVAPSVARGVYKTDPLRFDAAGFWEATARFTIDGRRAKATAAFEVLGEHQLPYVGEAAPRTEQALAGDPAVPAVAVDSRAQDGQPVPDPQLHRTTVAAAVAARRPVMVVLSTPSYCRSRFCGPVTDAVARLESRYRDRMDFVHLEVWADFTAGRLNPWVRDWIVPRDGEDTREPWVFVVGADGTIVDRFDNLASDSELEAAVGRVVGGGAAPTEP